MSKKDMTLEKFRKMSKQQRNEYIVDMHKKLWDDLEKRNRYVDIEFYGDRTEYVRALVKMGEYSVKEI